MNNVKNGPDTQWWSRHTLDNNGCEILPPSLCSRFSPLHHGTMFLLVHFSLSSLCQRPTGMVPGNPGDAMMTYRQCCALKMSMRPLGCCRTEASHSQPHKQATSLDTSVNPILPGFFWAARAVTWWPSHLSIIQIARETFEVLQKARGEAQPPSWTDLLQNAGSQALHQLDQNQETQWNIRYSSKSPPLINKSWYLAQFNKF